MRKNIYFITILLLVAIGGGIFVLYKQITHSTPSSTPMGERENIKTYVSSFSLEKAPSQSLKGNISDMDGEIKWQARMATEAAKINSPIEIQQGENLFTGEDGSFTLTFLGVCIVDIIENTEIDVIQTLPKNIVFSQIDGTVTYSNLGENPITVRTSYLLTQFDGDIKIVRDSEKSTITISVITGNAIFAYNDKELVSHTVEAKNGQTYTFNYGTRQGVLK